jgi:hypothetical protein
MKLLNEAVRMFQETCVRHDQLKEAFRDPRGAGVDFLDAREAFFACQPAYEAARQELTEVVRTIHKRARLISEYDRLGTELRIVVIRALREEGLEELLDTRRKIRSFGELVQAWYLAKVVADVAAALRDARYSFEDEEFDRILVVCAHERGEAGELVMANYEDTLESRSDDGANSWDAVRVVNDEARRNFEGLCDEIIEMVERLRASGDWEDEKQHLEHDVWRALCSYIEIHTPKLQPAAQVAGHSDRMVDTETLDHLAQ